MERAWQKSYDPEVPLTIECPKEDLPTLLENTAREKSAHTATEFLGAKLTYGTLWDHVLRLSNALHRIGVRPGNRVAIMLPNCPQSIIAFYAVLRIGAVVILTNPMYVQREIEHQWNDAGAEFAIILDHLFPKVEKALPASQVRKVVVTSIREYFPIHLKYLYPLRAWARKLFTRVLYDENTLNFSSLIKDSKPEPPDFKIDSDDVALLQYTGGTTGISKGVMLSHRNILVNVLQINAWVPNMLSDRDRFLSILPIFHVFGMTVAMNLPLYLGSTLILVPRFDPWDLLETIRKKKPTVFPAVPTIFTAMLNHPKIDSCELSSIRFCITGSAPMMVETLRRFELMTGSTIIEGYGLTEASPVTHCNPAKGVRKSGSIGIPLPGTDQRIVDLDLGTTELSQGKAGELTVRGPQVMQGYWKRPDETAGTVREGWLYTGDIARVDEDGYVTIVDRKKDMIIAGGYNIYPREIDEVLSEHPKILDAATIGLPDPYRGETVKAFVVLRPGEHLSVEELVAFCKQRLAAYKVPRSIEFRGSLPKTTVGKVSRKELRMEALQDASEPK